MKIINWFKNNIILSTIFLIAALLRFYHVDMQSVWLDEIHTLNEANPKLSLPELYDTLVAGDPHPPLYFVILHFIFMFFGYTTFVLKMFSAIVGVAGISAIYLLGKELFSKKIGVYAAILLTFNYFHLYYSQEARMYSLLFLMTILSFYYLIKFIKAPTIKSSIIYGVFSALMIYCHFFALFTLFSQYLILLFFIFRPFNISSKKFFYYDFIAGMTTLVLYIPTFKIIIKTTQTSSIWIQMPTLDVYTQIFKDFFGQSELVVFFVILLIIVYFIQLIKVKNSKNFTIDPINDQLVFSFIILFIWILITMLIPLIRTYTSLPMLINRYFINILPAIILIMAIGLSFIRSSIVRFGILGFILIFSYTDIVIVKNYFNKINKTQFREVSQFIIDNNDKKEPVVTSLGWYFPYFLNNDKVKMTIIDKPLDILVNEMIVDSTKRRPFWYVDAHNRPYKISESSQKYLDSYFEVDSNADFYDAWTKHYVIIGTSEISIKKINKNQLLKSNGDLIKFGIDDFKIDSKNIYIEGWAIFEKQDATNAKLNLILKSEKNDIFFLKFQKVIRNDVTKAFSNQFNLDNSGFSSKTDCTKLLPGKYQLGIFAKDIVTKKEGFVFTGKFILK